MGFFGIDTYREPSLIPPDEDDNPDCIVAEEVRSEHLIRRTFKDGHIEWTRLPHDPVGYEQDCFEEAYEMGQKSSHEESFAAGVFAAARTAYTREAR